MVPFTFSALTHASTSYGVSGVARPCEPSKLTAVGQHHIGKSEHLVELIGVCGHGGGVEQEDPVLGRSRGRGEAVDRYFQLAQRDARHEHRDRRGHNGGPHRAGIGTLIDHDEVFAVVSDQQPLAVPVAPRDAGSHSRHRCP